MAFDGKRSGGGRRWVRVVLCLVLLGLLGIGVAAVMSYRVTREIDVNSGMKREQVAVLGVVIESEVSDTRFSRFAKGSVALENGASWRRESVLYLPPFLRRRPSPHFVLHGAFQSLDSLMDAFVVLGTGEARKQELAQQALHHLQRGENFSVEITPDDKIKIRN